MGWNGADAEGSSSVGETFVLPENFDIRGITQVYSDLNLRLAGGNERIVVDGSKVTRVDTTGIQLLLVARQFAGENSRQFEMSQASDVLTDAANVLGVATLLGLTVENEGVD